MNGIDVTAVIEGLLADGHGVLFAVHGDSMEPLIRSGDMLLVEPVESETIRSGHVVLATADRGLTAHRVLERRGETIVMRGDNAPAPDDPLPVSRVLGLVVDLERNGKRQKVRRLSGWTLFVARLSERVLQRIR